MLLVLTNSADATASFLLPILDEAGIPFCRLDTDTLVSKIKFTYRLGQATITLDGHLLQPQDVHAIWYRRPQTIKHAQFDSTPEGDYVRAEWSEFLECFFAHVPREKWVNHPSCNAVASRKLEQLTTAATLGFKVPDTLVTQRPEELQHFYREHHGQVIIKPISTGYIERKGEDKDSLIYTNRVLRSHLDNLDDLANCPALFQKFIQKKNDVRITVVGNDIHAVSLVASDPSGEQRCDIRRNNMADVIYGLVTLPEKVRQSIRRLMRHYKLQFGAIDMVVSVSGEWYFLEINPNGQWAWLDQTGGTNIGASFVRKFRQKGRKGRPTPV